MINDLGEKLVPGVFFLFILVSGCAPPLVKTCCIFFTKSLKKSDLGTSSIARFKGMHALKKSIPHTSRRLRFPIGCPACFPRLTVMMEARSHWFNLRFNWLSICSEGAWTASEDGSQRRSSWPTRAETNHVHPGWNSVETVWTPVNIIVALDLL